MRAKVQLRGTGSPSGDRGGKRRGMMRGRDHGHQSFPLQWLRWPWSWQRAGCPSERLTLPVQGGPRARLKSSEGLFTLGVSQSTENKREIPAPSFMTPPFCHHLPAAVAPAVPVEEVTAIPRKAWPPAPPYRLLHGREQPTAQHLATGVHQDKFTSPETQQLGPRGQAADLGEISGLSSFSLGFFLVFFFLPPSARPGCGWITLCLAVQRARAPEPSYSQPGKTH